MKDEHLGLFASPSRNPEAEHAPSTSPARPTSNSYQFKDDGYDEYRRLCQTFMSQSYAERAIRAARVFGWDAIDFQIKLENSKCESEENVRTGKCAVENFGKYFAVPLEERAESIKEQERKEEAEQRRLEYLNSPEDRKAAAEREKAVAANPLDKLHSVTVTSLTDRVRFSESPMQNYRDADKMLTEVGHHCRKFVSTKRLGTQEEVDTIGDIRAKIMKRALAAINSHYQQEIRATPDELMSAIDEAIAETEPAMTPMIVEVPEVAHAG